MSNWQALGMIVTDKDLERNGMQVRVLGDDLPKWRLMVVGAAGDGHQGDR